LICKKDQRFQIIAEAATANEALAIIEKEALDLLFLDIPMPEKNGFDLLQANRGAGDASGSSYFRTSVRGLVPQGRAVIYHALENYKLRIRFLAWRDDCSVSHN
jgi:DNA-binding NarL/FixJ family response regulator